MAKWIIEGWGEQTWTDLWNRCLSHKQLQGDSYFATEPQLSKALSHLVAKRRIIRNELSRKHVIYNPTRDFLMARAYLRLYDDAYQQWLSNFAARTHIATDTKTLTQEYLAGLFGVSFYLTIYVFNKVETKPKYRELADVLFEMAVDDFTEIIKKSLGLQSEESRVATRQDGIQVREAFINAYLSFQQMSLYLADPRRISDPSFPSELKIPSAEDLDAIVGNITPEKTKEKFSEALKKEYETYKKENRKL